MTPLEIAIKYIGYGWAPIPVEHKSKKPTGKDWQNTKITEVNAKRWFNGGEQNIGVRLGEPSGGLSDVDLDCVEAIDAAPAFLPRTKTFGRASKRCSHWLYKTGLSATENAATIDFKDTQQPAKVIAEIRIGGGDKGAQTVFPGSVHPSGEPIEWDSLDEVAEIDGADLKQRCAKLAACVLVARAYPRVGGRHEGAIVIAGFLCRCGVGSPDIKLFVDTVAAVTLQPPDKARDMVRAAADAAAAFAAGRNTFGLPKMIEVFGKLVAKRCALWLGYKAETHGENGRRASDARSGDFIRGELGQILKGRHQNIRRAIESLNVHMLKNEFSGQTEIVGLPGVGKYLTDAGATRLRFLIEETYEFLPGKELFEDVLIDVAHQNRFHPVLDYLTALAWDGIPQIDNWLHVYGGAEDTPFNCVVGRIFLIAAVRRVRKPGCKFDTMLVFESPVQGRNKSQAARILATCEDWFNDNLPLGAKPQEVIEQIEGHWVIEFPELAGISSREIEHVKAFLSRQVDRARPAYGRRRENIPRQFVAVGTTNDEEYLKNDERRFWPVRIEKFNIEALDRDVGQLWAEAAHYEAEGEPITLPEDLWPAATEVRAARTFENPYRTPLMERFGFRNFVTAEEVWECLGIARENRQRYGREVGKAIRDLGFTRSRATRDDGKNGLKRGDYFYERT